MKIPLSLIRPSPTPVRTTWDEDKMNELAQSIKEQGVIVPVKVRPVNGHYELVYGHRRTEASRRAGTTEIEAVVEEVDDQTAIAQALIENVQREDMQPLEVAHALKALMQAHGWNMMDVERAGIMSHGQAGRYLGLLAEPEEIQALVARGNTTGMPDGTIGYLHVEAIRKAGLEEGTRVEVARKVAQEGLGHRQAAQVAAAVVAAPSPEAKRALLEMPYSPVIHDPDMIKSRAARYGAHDPLYQDNTPTRQQQYDQTPEIRAVVEGVIEDEKRWKERIKVMRRMTEIGKLTPESRQFIAHRTRRIAKTLTDWTNELEAKE